MSLAEGQIVELQIEKPVAGGRMIARHEGQVVLVRGAIPGERVVARVERAEKRMAYAVVRDVIDASADRRPAFEDSLCGGALYSHITYSRQLAIKSDVIRDGFARLGKYPIERPIDVAASPKKATGCGRGSTSTARGPASIERERTSSVRPVERSRWGPTRLPQYVRWRRTFTTRAPGAVTEIALAENLAVTQRAAHLELAPGAQLTERALDDACVAAALQGLSARDMTTGAPLTAGSPAVVDELADVTGTRVRAGTLRRRAESFFQGNRFLLAALVTAVADAVPHDGEIVDLYAGVGLFSVTLAAMGCLEVTAVEGDRSSGEDLRENARPVRAAARCARGTGRGLLCLASRARARRDHPRSPSHRRVATSDVIADSARRAASGLRVVRSPTLARDARRLLDAGYRLDALRAFDFFPNTPHVEALAVFTKLPALS